MVFKAFSPYNPGYNRSLRVSRPPSSFPMQWALTTRGSRIEARRSVIAYCPGCNERVIPKCGMIKVHHWSHKSGTDCDPWWEPETSWHRYWKSYIPKKQQEVTIANHRADIVLKNGTVIELQHSSISPKDIIAREKTYKRMIWIFDGRKLKHRFQLIEQCADFIWMHPRLSIRFCKQPIVIDLGPSVFIIQEMNTKDTPWRGDGFEMNHQEFINSCIEEDTHEG